MIHAWQIDLSMSDLQKNMLYEGQRKATDCLQFHSVGQSSRTCGPQRSCDNEGGAKDIANTSDWTVEPILTLAGQTGGTPWRN